jgi:hypothetical protein
LDGCRDIFSFSVIGLLSEPIKIVQAPRISVIFSKQARAPPNLH